MKIAVTGGSGQFGRAVTASLLERVPPSDLVVITRRPETLADVAARGVEVRAGDFDRPEELPAAFAGCDRALVISTLSVGRRAEQHGAAFDAAVAAGVGHLAYTSSTGLHPDSPALVIADHLASEERLRACGVPFTILRDGWYAEVVPTALAPQALVTGSLYSSAGEGLIAPVSKRDCVAVAAAVLTEPGHENATYEVTGPDLLSWRDITALITEVTGVPIEYVPVSRERMDAIFAAAGIPEDYVEGMEAHGPAWSRSDMLSYEQAIREGYFAVRSDHVQQVLGRPARSLREVLADTPIGVGTP